MRKTIGVSAALLTLGLIVAVGCGVAGGRARALKTKSMSNLKQISMALEMFAAENNAYPKTLEELTPDKIDEGVLESPTKSGKKGYGYVAGLKPDGDTNIVAFDLKHNFEGGRNVLATDGNVAWMIEAKFQEGLQRTLKNAKDSGADAKVVE